MPAAPSDNRCSWHIRLLGAVEVVSPTGAVFHITRKKPAELLAFLALNTDRSHNRNSLADLIWGDTEVGDARTRLRQEISRLRTLIPSTDAAVSPLQFTQETCRIDPSVNVDVLRFTSCCSMAESTTDPEVQLSLLREAASLYKGYFLKGVEAPWVIPMREKLHQQYCASMHMVSDLQLQCADSSAARRSLEQFVLHSSQKAQSMEPSQHAGVRDAVRPVSVDVPDVDLQATGSGFRAASRYWIYGFLATLIFIGLSGWIRMSQRPPVAAAKHTSVVPAIRSTSHRWAYSYAPRRGELPNSEGKAITADSSGIYVAGIIQTTSDDTDILTLKLTHFGELLWIDRYSSPEHDCDRAFSICKDVDRGARTGTGQADSGIYIGGESFIPSGHGETEGWRLLLIRYDSKGVRLWSRRSKQIMDNIGESVRVCSDAQGGCYIAGTSVGDTGGAMKGARNVLVLHYDGNGVKLWERAILTGDRTVLCSIVANMDGTLFVCGTSQETRRDGDAKNQWAVLSIQPDGKTAWFRTEDGPDHIGGIVSQLALDDGGNLFVSGAFNQRSIGADTRVTSRLAVQKYNAYGARLWQRVDQDSGPLVVPQGLSVNINGSVLIGGTAKNLDGKWDLLTARFDSFGNETLSRRYQPLPGSASASLNAVNLFENEGFTIVGQLGIAVGSLMREESCISVIGCNPDGDIVDPRIYECAPHTINRFDANIMYPDMIVTGQTGPNNGKCTLTVVKY